MAAPPIAIHCTFTLYMRAVSLSHFNPSLTPVQYACVLVCVYYVQFSPFAYQSSVHRGGGGGGTGATFQGSSFMQYRS